MDNSGWIKKNIHYAVLQELIVNIFQTGDYLKHKIRSRPEKSELVNMHILQGKPLITTLSKTTSFNGSYRE